MPKVKKLTKKNRKGDTVTIRGVKYLVTKTKVFVHKGTERQQLILKRPKGTVGYTATRYSNGAVSEAVRWG